MRKNPFIIIIITVLLLSSCKSQYEILLEGNDVALKYKTAFELFEQGKYSKAASMFENLKIAVKGTLQDDTVQFYTGLSQYRYGDMFTAESCFESFLNVFPRSPFSEQANYYYLDCLYYQTLRYELDPTPTYKALSAISEYLLDHPDSQYKDECDKMVADLEERLDKKAFEGAKIYYITEDYKAAHYAFKNVLKEDADNQYREDIEYYTALSSYKYAFNSIQEKQKERYMTFTDDYYYFVGEFPDSKHRKELDNLFKKVQPILKKDAPDVQKTESQSEESVKPEKPAKSGKTSKSDKKK